MSMRPTAALLALLLPACVIGAPPSPPMWPTPPTPTASGWAYCAQISGDARRLANQRATAGYAFAVVGALSTAAGTAFPLAKSGELEFEHKFGSAAAIAVGATLFILGRALLARSDAASKLSGETASILGARNPDDTGPLDHVAAGQQCSLALAAWETSRADATALASELLSNQKARTEAAERALQRTR